MHHIVLERWSRGASFLHARDARVKLLALLVYLVALATTPQGAWTAMAGFGALVVAGALLAGLPPAGVALRATIVLPFTATFALISLAGGEPQRAGALLAKSYLSAAAVILLMGSTPLARLGRALESLGAPRPLVLVLQFLYRYLFVISEQAQHMRLARASRAPAPAAGRRLLFRAASGALAVLFARSYARAEGIHNAMLSRGFDGRIPVLAPARARTADFLFLAAACLAALAARLVS